MEGIEEIKEILASAKVELEYNKKMEKNARDMYAELVEQNKKVRTEKAKKYLNDAIKTTYKTLIEQGVGLMEIEAAINFYENMIKRMEKWR